MPPAAAQRQHQPLQPGRKAARDRQQGDALAAIEVGLGRYEGRVAITALHGLRGVGKTTLAAAYAELHRGDYRATWWIRAQSEPGMRADLVALGVRLGWASPDDKEEPALAAVMDRQNLLAENDLTRRRIEDEQGPLRHAPDVAVGADEQAGDRLGGGDGCQLDAVHTERVRVEVKWTRGGQVVETLVLAPTACAVTPKRSLSSRDQSTS